MKTSMQYAYEDALTAKRERRARDFRRGLAALTKAFKPLVDALRAIGRAFVAAGELIGTVVNALVPAPRQVTVPGWPVGQPFRHLGA